MDTTSNQLEGRVAVVTGGASGIGRGIAKGLAAAGAAVAIADVEDASGVAAECNALGERAITVKCDVTVAEEVAALRDEVTRELGPVGVLVNNAGIYPGIPFHEITLDDWRRVFGVNVESMVLTSQAFIPDMQAHGYGRIINLTSNSTGLALPGMTHYVSSKMAVIGLTRGLASELGPSGITVNAIAPSIVRTPTTEGFPGADEFFASISQLQAIKRTEVPEDVVGTVGFLASEASAFMTGQTLYIDGGLIRSA